MRGLGNHVEKMYEGSNINVGKNVSINLMLIVICVSAEINSLFIKHKYIYGKYKNASIINDDK